MRFFKNGLLVGLLMLSSLLAQALDAGRDFPIKPDPTITPGSLCQNSNQRRYPEKIVYCSRNVDSSVKWEIIRDYNQKLGFNIQPGQRSAFKIDHYVPLCMGGSNQVSNLWPQHQTVYEKTDPLEGLMCEKMAMGRLKQEIAIRLIREAKNDFSQISRILNEVRAL